MKRNDQSNDYSPTAAARMKAATLIAFLSIWIGSIALCAEDEQFVTLKVGTNVYTKVTIISVSATDVSFMHSRGVGNAKLKDLEPEMQRHFNYNPAKAAATQAQQAQANVQYRQTLLAAPKAGSASAPAAQNEAIEQETSSGDIIPAHPIYAKSFLGKPAPELQVQKWLTPQPETAGKFVLVDFWATWCGPCRAAIPKLNGFHNRFKDRLVVIGLSDETEAAVRRMTEPEIAYNIAIDTAARAEHAVGVRGIPHALLIDPKGVVRFEGMPHYLEADTLDRLMAKYSN